ncbi:MAG: hypothetical protein MSG64_03650 [Pyrinomonadaceae bacterium MAG19_C2-C3]|nr:hypothetical protein [Pyrinomonadaceae bacterium MAG19_C2-C3]
MNVVTELQDAGQPVSVGLNAASLPSLDEMTIRIKDTMGETWLAWQYRETIMPLRTRSFHLPVPARGQVRIEIQHTLLGLELKIGKQRVFCPDLATARYLAVWARLGCTAVAVPYDITRISRLADELESAWQRILLLISHLAAERTESFRSRLRAQIILNLRREIHEIGAGSAVPNFKQTTSQRAPVV